MDMLIINTKRETFAKFLQVRTVRLDLSDRHRQAHVSYFGPWRESVRRFHPVRLALQLSGLSDLRSVNLSATSRKIQFSHLWFRAVLGEPGRKIPLAPSSSS